MSDRPRVDPNLVKSDGEAPAAATKPQLLLTHDPRPTEARDDGLRSASQASGDDAAIERGREAWQRIRKNQTWNDWLQVGEALLVCRTKAMHRADTNRPIGAKFAKEMKHVLEQHGFNVIDESIRSRAIKCFENRAKIEEYRNDKLSPAEQLRLNHPTNILKKWEAHTKVKNPAAVSPLRKLKDRLIELQEENDKLKRQLANRIAESEMLRSGKGSGFAPSASAKEVIDRLRELHRDDFFGDLIAEATIARGQEKRQDGREADVARRRSRRKT